MCVCVEGDMCVEGSGWNYIAVELWKYLGVARVRRGRIGCEWCTISYRGVLLKLNITFEAFGCGPLEH